MALPSIRPRKRFGQHFLTQPSIARRIVDLATLRGGETVLEIGPGRGALTHLLAERAARLVLSEIDRDLCQELREQFAGQSHVTIVEGDVLDLDLAALLGPGPSVAVANLPYNITTPVLIKLLDTPASFSRLVLMLQREVADRICAEPGTKQYGALTVMVQLVATARVAFTVPPTAFAPRPKVDSAVVVIEPQQPPPLSAAARRSVRRVVRAAFSQRRKQLGNALASLGTDPHALLDRLGIDPRRRPETLSVEEFARIAAAADAPA